MLWLPKVATAVDFRVHFNVNDFDKSRVSGGFVGSVLERLSGSWPEVDPKLRSALIFVAFAAATLFCIVVPRIGPLFIVSVTTAVSAYLLARDTRREGWSALERIAFRPELLFALWAVIAATWSPEPMRGFGKSLFLFALILHAIILAKEFRLADGRDIETAARGMLAGFLLSGIYVCLEIDGRSNITRFILTYFPELDRAVDKHARIRDGVIVRISGAHITRVSAVFCLFLCPALIAATLYTKGWIRGLCYATVAAFLLLIFFHPQTHSQTAQLIITIATATLLVALIAPKLARWGVAAGFAAWLFLIVPGSLAMYSHGVHEKEDLFRSARARVLIWHSTAEEILKRPIFGAGTTSSRFFEESPNTKRTASDQKLGGGLDGRGHPHNMYLQVWYELGLVGVLAFAILGFSLWARIASLPQKVAVFATTHFAVCGTIIGPSYSIWQNWFQSAFALSILTLVLIASANMKPEGATQPALSKEKQPVGASG